LVHHPDLIELDLRSSAPVAPPVMPSGATTSAVATDQCRTACPELLRRTEQLESNRVQDLTAVVGALQETMSALGAEMASWHGDVQASAGRFGALVSQPDPERLRSQLLEEVHSLKQVVVNRRQRWDATKKAYAERVTSLETQLRTTRVEASTDGLTGLANRRAFDRELTHRLRSSHERVALALFDVDNFKGVNDTKGHAEGDVLLKTIATTIAASVRPGDVVARLGGDEFAVIVGGLTLRQAESRFAVMVSEICTAIHGVSCGLAEFSAGDTEKSLYDRADSALYDAKHNGKHRVAVRDRPSLRAQRESTRGPL
jgi:diguanylate cyclase